MEDPTMMRRSFLATPALALAACAAACTPNAGAAPAWVAPAPAASPHLLTITGSATIDVAPDYLDIHMVVTAEDPHPRAAVAALRARQTRLLKGLHDAGVNDADVKTSQLSLSPTYDDKGHATGYRADLTAVASTKDFDRAGDLLEIAAAAGATNIATGYHRSDIVEMKERVRTMALSAAKAKAEQSAKVLDVRLEGLAAVNEMGGAYSGDGSGVSNTYNTASSAGAGTSLNPASAPLSITVTLTYEIGARA
jgi:uncharacterized protein YggE